MVDTGFETDGTAPAGWDESDGRLVVDLDGFEGPLDVLLALARDQKVDLTRISILQLADQYLDFIESARALRLEIAADYLVMAAWLAYLKSRLLLPEPEGEEEPTGEELAEALAFHLRRLEAIREAGSRLMSRAQLGRDIFARGAPEGVRVIARPVFDVEYHELLTAYAGHKLRTSARRLRIEPSRLYTMDQALHRLMGMVGATVEWTTLERFLPPLIGDAVIDRSVLASTLAASLELARQGKMMMRQAESFGPIYLRGTGGRE
jgi:segregation and condensation protein A